MAAKIILTVVFLSGSLVAQNNAFWTGTAALGASVVADGVTTQDMLSRGCYEAWSPTLYGRYPSNARFYGVSFAIEGGFAFAAYKLIHSKHKPMRIAGYGLLGGRTAVRTQAAVHNSRLRCK